MSANIVRNQFPRIVWRDNEKYLWNPIRRQPLKNRPEERIRLRVMEFLLEAGWSKHRISTEEGITSSQKGNLRTDLICYTDDFTPFLLVECKAPKIHISEQTAEQIARYNQQINARYLLMTNGKTDLWYAFEEKNDPALQKQIPEPFRNDHQPAEQSFSYWADRGFAGKEAKPGLRTWLTEILNNIRTDDNPSALHYLSFKKKLSDTDLNHYYSLHSYPEQRIALAFIGTAYGGTRLVAVINRDSNNVGVLELNLDLLFNRQTPNASLYTAKGRTNIDILHHLEWNTKSFRVDSFVKQVNEHFKAY